MLDFIPWCRYAIFRSSFPTFPWCEQNRGDDDVLIDRRTWTAHRTWFYFAVVVSASATAWYIQEAIGAEHLPGGSSLAGFTFGIVGGVICIFELLLWPRKKVRSWRIGRAQVWLRAHIWLGLLSLPLLVLHSGFRFGGTLSTTVMVLFLIVIASGVWGLAMQQWLPRKTLHEAPAETVYSQIDYVARQNCADAERLVLATCGPEAGASEGGPEKATTHQFLTIGAVRSVGRTQGMVLQTVVPRAPVAGAEPLRAFFYERVVPFLREGRRSGSPLRYADRAQSLFGGLRTLLPADAQSVVDTLEEACAQRRQLDHQATLHFWLHNWLWLHLPLAVALIVLMLVHAWYAVMYW
jgi:hypothetical protein